jgi:hypothetical protein
MIRNKSVEIVLMFVALISTSCKTWYVTPFQAKELSLERTVLPLSTGQSSNAAETTDTPLPTRKVIPTIPKTPGVYDCSDIVYLHKESTPEQWEQAKNLLKGSMIYYTGTVNVVTETNVVHMTGSMCHPTLHNVPHEISINLSRGQLIEGYGTIKNISSYLGEDIDIEVNPDLLFVR